ncbi:MAG: DUF2163 domain-containing protein [Leptothrix sp. (in: b-proteobacteria)]
MKKPTWEPSAGNLLAWLAANNQARPIDLFTLTTAAGTVYRWSGGDVAVTVNALAFVLGPSIQRSRVKQSIGTSVDTMNLTLFADATVLVGGVPLMQALAAGVFTGATMQLERAFFDAGNVCQGTVGVFMGRLGTIKLGRSVVSIEVRSHAELLDVMVPGDVYQPGCRNTLFDAQCTLSAAAYTVAGLCAAGEATRSIVTSSSAAVLSRPAAWADLGVLQFTNGLNAGISRTVRSHAVYGGSAVVTVVFGFPYAIAAGDAFTLRAGCNKSYYGDCGVKFGNAVNFRGEPFIPAPESVT